MSTKRKGIIEGGKSLLKKFGKKAAAGVLGVGGALLNTQKAYGGQLSKKQAKYIGVNQKGPFKPNYYRY